MNFFKDKLNITENQYCIALISDLTDVIIFFKLK